MIRCNACGAAHPANTLFCDECGNRLSQEHKVTKTSFAVQPPAEDAPFTIHVSTPNADQQFEILLDKSALIGRKDDSAGAAPDIDLEGLNGKREGVSRRHARLVRQGRQVLIEDLNSLNGTFVRGARLPAHTPHVVQSDDELQFGKLVLKIEFESEARD